MNKTLFELIADGAKQLKASKIENPKFESEILLAFAIGESREDMFLSMDRVPPQQAVDVYNDALQRRSQYEPIAYIVGHKEFWSLPFKVSTHTLIPRPDTERLVECALDEAGRFSRENLSILDLGTGSGCILIAILSELKCANGIGSDKSPEALKIAEHNAVTLLSASRAQFICWDWRETPPKELINKQFDVIVSNPPYIADAEEATLPPDVIRFEPRGALMAGLEGLDEYHYLAGKLPTLLVDDGTLLMEIGMSQGKAVQEIFHSHGWKDLQIKQDYAGRDRVIIAKKP